MGHFLLFPAPHGGTFVAFCTLLKQSPPISRGGEGGGSGFTLTGALVPMLYVVHGCCDLNVVSFASSIFFAGVG